jgi:hypothetical protein
MRLNVVTSQKIILVTDTAMRTSELTMGRLSMEITDRDGNCQIFPHNFQWAFRSVSVNFRFSRSSMVIKAEDIEHVNIHESTQIKQNKTKQ